MSVGDLCEWSYILGHCSVLMSRLWEGRFEETEPQRLRRSAGDRMCTRAGTPVMELLGRATSELHSHWISFH